LTTYVNNQREASNLVAQNGGTLILDSLTTLQNVNQLTATSGGHIDLSDVTTLDSNNTQIIADGTGSIIDLSNLTDFSGLTFTTLNGGIIIVRPVANNDEYTLDEDTILTIAADGVLANDINPANDPLTTELVTDTTYGTVNLSEDGSFTYTPDSNFVGTDSFTYRVTGAETLSSIATVALTVNNIDNDAPTDIQLSSTNIDENSVNGTPIGNLTVFDPDPDDTHILTLVDDAEGRFTLVDQQLQVADGSLLDAETNTSHTITVKAEDANGLSLEKEFVITVNNLNDIPTVSITPTTITEPEGNSETTEYTYTVNLSNPTDQVVTVDYSTNDGTATVADNDYIDNDGTLTFNPGEPLSQDITILVNGDTNIEEDETFTLTVNSATNAILESGTIVETIGNTTEIAPPSSITLGSLESNSEAFVFLEQSGLVLPSDLDVNITLPGNVTGSGSTSPGTVASGTVINSYFLHFDPIARNTATISGSITFNSDVIGVIFGNNLLNNTDSLLGASDTIYSTGLSDRAVDIAYYDDLALSEDLRTLSFDLRASDFVDQLRVITEATLEATGTIENDDFNAGVLTFSTATYEVVEDNNTAQITIIREDGSDGEVTVDYSTSDGTATAGEDYTAVSGTLTFNDGESVKTITIPINNDSDVEADESFTITLSNPTGGAVLDTENTATITITDTDIPDLIVSNLSASTPIYTDKTATVNYRVENQGSAIISGSWVDQVYLSTDNQLDETDTLLSENTFTPSTPFDSFYERDLTFFTPETPGQYYLIAVTDSTNTVDEGSDIGETNNTNIIPITVEPAYRATVFTNTEISLPGDSITFEGTAISNADNSPAPYELVTIAVKHNGFVREFHISTEEDGSFTQDFTPLAGEAGNYEINAYFPGYLAEDSAPEDSFKLLGMDFNQTGVFHQILADNPFTEQVELANLTDIPLTGLTYTVNDAPDDWNIEVIAPETLAGDGINDISYTIQAPNDSLFTQDTFSINVNSDQGVTATLPVTVNVKQLVPQLVANVNRLNTGMLRGEQSFVEFKISNNGGLETGNIQVMLPQIDWLSLNSPSTINSLLPGESTNVTLSLTPDNDLPLTLYNGNLVFDVIGKTGDLSLPYTFRAVSEAVGSVEVTAIDERFYFAENTPKLDNATVKIRDYFTGEIIAQGVTNETGTINLDNLSEGYYQLNVEAENHDSYQQTIEIKAGQITEIQSFLSRQSVSYLWRVLPTQIEDRYVITIESVFETNVPEPVVTISPALIDLETLQTVGQVIQTEMTLTNQGLIAANDVTLNFGDHPFYNIEPLVDDIGVLAAQSSLTIPVRVTRIDDFSDENQNDYIACGIPASLQWSYDCGPNTVVKTTPIPILNVEGNCPTPPIIPLPYRPYRPYRPSNPSNPSIPPTGGTSPIQAISSATPVIITPQPDCNICAQVRLQTTQDAVMTRSAFLGILDIDNGNEIPLENLSVTLDIRDAFGNPVNGLFAIADPTLSNLNAVDGTGILTPDTTGTAQWTIVPTANAAPETPTVYSIGGSLNYTEDGTVITVPLLGTPVTVLPQAELYVDYFHQREVFSDDPFTDEIEPSIPFVLGVMVRNEGYGAANNFQITSAQPKIIENEKGLLIDFDIIATELGINPVNPSLSINFEDIEAGETTVANWLFKSSLQGKFIEYDATFEHINDLGLAELSLIEAVNIHELTHKVRVDHPEDDQLPDFLVNDIADDNFYPDTLYFSDGNTAPVNVLTTATTTVDGQTITVTATVDQGWTYFRLDDPTNGELKITQVLRDDGTALRSDNFWTSDRTFPESGRPIYEDILHLLDYHDSSGEITYTLTTTQLEINEPPNAQNDAIETDEDVPVTINILANDHDVDGDSLAISQITQTTHGSLNLNADNTLTYTPYLNFNGTDSFTYTIEDGQGGRDRATVSLNVIAVNDAPVAEDDAVETNEDNSLTLDTATLLANDHDVDDTVLNIDAVDDSTTTGTVTLNDTQITYDPNGQFEFLRDGETATDTFTYTVDDELEGSDTATVTVTIAGVNDPATIIGNPTATVTEDNNVDINGQLNATGSLTVNDVDTDENKFNTDVSADPNNFGSLTITEEGVFSYTVNNDAVQFLGVGQTKIDRFTVTSFDGTANQEITITINGINDLPDALDDIAHTDENSPVVIDVLANDSDIDGDILTVDSTGLANHGTVTLNEDGTVTYIPEQDFFGTDSFTYQVTDGINSAEATVDLTIYEVIPNPNITLVTGTIYGDILTGTENNDLIVGGGGGDMLTGNGGDDIFAYYDLSEGGDFISDFNSGDRIDLSDVLISFGNSDPWGSELVACEDFYGLGTAVTINDSPFVILQNTPLDVANQPENFIFA
ncbi:MAG: Ig-like domain-containing protein, partial [Crocosphaera sp.]|nr:Ig-like domain-containing protein [Crocosphaera sp.]